MSCLITTHIIILLTFRFAAPAVFYTDPNTDVTDKRDGSWSKPFETVADCVKALENPGDECQIREGRYREEIDVQGLTGTEEQPIVIRGYGNERPILDGTVEITPEEGEWQRDGNIYFGKIKHTIWQLFFDDLMMTNARWPDANWSKKTLFDGNKNWAKTSKTSKRGKIIDDGDALKNSGKDMTGAMAILNIGSWNTFVAPVELHNPGDNFFTYEDTFGKIHLNMRAGKFYLEDKLELLDAAEEWFFDKDSSTLYFIPPADRSFTPTTMLRGKVQTYALTITDSRHVVLKNIDFFGTTLTGTSKKWRKDKFIDKIRFDSLNFMYPCASKRMLLEKTVVECTWVSGRNGKGLPTDAWGNFTFYNNTFYGADGPALGYEGSRVLLENNLFEYNDWTSANSLVGEGGHGTLETWSVHDTYRRNTFRYNGESHGLRPGYRSNVTLNRVIGQCWGEQANDGSGIQVTQGRQNGTVVYRNWVSDSPRGGVRFDGNPPKTGDHGTLVENVMFRTSPGAQVKGDYHTVMDNLAFNAPNGNSRPFPRCGLCLWKYVRELPGEINANSIFVRNLADTANGGKMFKDGKRVKPLTVWPLNAGFQADNIVDPDVKSLLRDPENLDFRPVDGSVTAGPYSYDPRLSTYWIPGRQIYKASSPVPPNGARRVVAAHRDALMWLNALDCETHLVYFGTNEAGVIAADDTCTEFKVTDGGNVVYLTENLEAGKKYFWRVDALCPDGMVKGDVWKFTAV